MPPLPARGAVVKALRVARGILAMDLAATAGISKSQLSHIEAGRGSGGPARHAPAIAAALGVAVEVLTGQTPPIAALREAERLDFGRLAHDLGITTDALSRLETGADLPDRRLADAIARRLGVDRSVIDHDSRAAA